MNWVPPTDTRPEDIGYYIIRDSINGVHNETSPTSTQTTFEVSQCNKNRNITVSIVDRCGQEGPSSGNFQLNLSPPIIAVTDNTTLNRTTNAPIIGKLINKKKQLCLAIRM